MTRPARLGALAMLVILALTTATPVAAATHGGTRGVHVLIDSPEYPGQICHYAEGSLNVLHRIALRRPVIFAPDTTSGRDKRWVGWRFRLQRSDDDGTTWATFFTSPIKKAIAYDDQPAPLPPRGRDFIPAEAAVYRAAVDLYWYTATSSTNQTGRATHVPDYRLEVLGDMEAPGTGVCPATIDATAAARATAVAASPAGAPHGGEVGLHTLIDSPHEFPGVKCVYNSNNKLVKLRVRAPVVYAQETFSGPQQVRWRFAVEGSDGGPTTLVHTSTWTKAPATDLTAARWSGRSLAVDGNNWDYWIVSVRMEWLGAGSPNPYAAHSPYHQYKGNVFGYCST